MIKNWNFPSNNNGVICGINDAGIESFTGDLFGSLAKEICQNSLDAVLDDSRPVTVEFNTFNVNKESLPGSDELQKAIVRCKDFWGKQSNTKSVDFFKAAEQILNKQLIQVLRISDLNTTGLTGSKELYNSPWCNLVKSSGVSDKGGASGGSFGIGKSAPFACSYLRTVLYSTLDKDGVQASQGVARLATFRKDDDDFTQGTGYFGNIDKNQAMPEMMSLDNSYVRTSPGTDLYVLGFIGEQDWITNIVASVLTNFLLAIYYGKLEVNVSDVKINKETLPNLIEAYKDKIKSTYDYYTVLTSSETITVDFNHNGLGVVELLVLLKPNLNRRILTARSNGMKIFDMSNMPAAIHFSGILTLKDESINSYFRKMETPQHDKWQSDRHPDKKGAEKNRKELLRYIKDKLNELSQLHSGEELDAEGMGDYIPDALPSDLGANNDKVECLSDKIITPEIKIITRNPIVTNMEESENGDAIQQIETTGTISGEEDTDFDGGNLGDVGSGSSTSRKEASSISEGEGSDEIYSYIKVLTPNIRVFQKNTALGAYRLIFIASKSVDLGAVGVRISGESAVVKLKVIKSSMVNPNKTRLNIKQNYIHIPNMNKGEKYVIDFYIDDKYGYPLEVIIYEANK